MGPHRYSAQLLELFFPNLKSSLLDFFVPASSRLVLNPARGTRAEKVKAPSDKCRSVAERMQKEVLHIAAAVKDCGASLERSSNLR